MPIDIAGLQAAMAGRYALERELGYGATASVYLARDLKVPKHVAIKVLNPDIALAVTTERFRREIKNTAPLNHNYILGLSDADVAYDTQTGGEILYYVMTYVEGGSLRDRLKRDGALPVREAVRIAWEVADALAYAHKNGVIHRDIKPGNILLGDEHIWVADFGIARKLEDEALTATGAEPGTPSYESPEQHASAGVDHRTDIYSLGCVLYEMLVGQPPFSADTVEGLAVQRLSGPAPAVRDSRPVPLWLDQVVAKALAQRAEDRYQTAIEFRDALRLRAPWIPVAWRSAAAVAAVGGIAWVTNGVINGGGLTAADTLTYAVLPVAYADSAGAERITAALHDALARWTGISIVDPSRVREATRSYPTALSVSEAQRVARRLKSGRYVRIEAVRFADSLRVHAMLHDGVNEGSTLRERTTRLSAALDAIDSAASQLIEGLLFTDTRAPGGTRTFQARQAQERGLAAVGTWDLPKADSAFFVAANADPEYAQAHFWLAQVRFWSGAEHGSWSSAVERAARGRTMLQRRDQTVADALLLLSRGDHPGACDVLERLTQEDPFAFAGWYGLARCLARDSVVVPHQRSPSSWRFRTSYHHALIAYRRAFQLLPATHKALKGTSYLQARQLFWTAGNAIRRGRGLPPDSLTFHARPVWDGDTLVFVPYPTGTTLPGPATSGTRIAAQKVRELFREVATAWVAAYPDDPDALEALAVSLEMLGDPACLDTLRRARSLATDRAERARLAVGEVWLQVKFALPLDNAGLRAAKRLADSLLTAPFKPDEEGRLLASVAALTGRAYLAAEVNERAPAYWRGPAAIARTAPRLLVFAALGGPVDSIRSLEERVSASIDLVGPSSDQRNVRLEWVARAATLAFPSYQMDAVKTLAGTGDPLLDAQESLSRSDTVTIRRYFDDLRARRRHYEPQYLTIDGLFPESALLAAMGENLGAAAWLDPTLSRIAATPPLVFTDPARAAALVRAMALRAEIANQLGDRAVTARWARAVLVLWSDADDFLAPVVHRMEQLAR